MDKVTQQVAANAEESAAASQEMSSQAEGMSGYVQELVGVIGGSLKKLDGVFAAEGEGSAREVTAEQSPAITESQRGGDELGAGVGDIRAARAIPLAK
jgi:methyl-accepting chemotaxis protein